MLSIIVPIYNAEQYLSECLDSILKQDCQDMEIICVNDGSTDGSLSILDNYQQADKRIRIVNKANSGYGDSMNIGIQASQGEYIGIVESDDFVAGGAFSHLLDLAEQYDADVVKGNYYLYSKDTTPALRENMPSVPKEALLSKKEINELFFVAPSIWSAVYKRSFLIDKGIWFRPSPGAAYQDTAFAFKVWANAERVVATEKGTIYYRTDNMASSSKESNKIFDICDEFEEIQECIRKTGRKDLWPIFSRVKYISYFWNLNRLVPEKKTVFLDGIYHEIEMFRKQGWLDEPVWPESDRAVITRVLDHFEKYKSDLLEGKAFYEAGV